ERVADRAVLWFHGKVSADGTLDEIRQNPDARARTFLAGRYGEEDRTEDRSRTSTGATTP
ncbi:MAG: hypothetical protein AAGB34_11230, partial [Planctomycetota bacterium]